MDYREFAPPPSLRRFVQCLWTLRASGPPGPPQRVLPDGSVEVVLHLGDRFRRHDAERRAEFQPRALVVGDVARWMILEPGATVDLVGIRFRPGAARGVLGVPPRALLGGCYDLDTLGMPPLRGLLERVGNAAHDAGRRATLWAALDQAVQCSQAPTPAVLYAFARIAAERGRLAIGDLARETGWSLRHLERRVRDESGMSLKALARLRRFQAIVARLQADHPPVWTHLAIQAGFHDQPHLVREFQVFAGTTPAAYWREVHPLSDLFHQPVENLQDADGDPR